MGHNLLDRLVSEGSITSEQYAFFTQYEANKPLSLSWELKTVLYLGVLLFSSGAGLLIYQNIDTIGHQAIIALIGVVTFTCFYYAYRNQPSFSITQVQPTSAFAGYILLLGCLTFLTLEGYLQFQYNIFGTRYGLVTFLPAVLFFLLAYYFDHRGVLSLALTALASWVGVSVTPLDILENNDFSEPTFIYMALALGAGLVATGWYLGSQNIKKHFTFTYLNFAANLLFIATLAGLFIIDAQWPLFAFLLAGLCYGFLTYARRSASFWFMLIAVIYGYIGLTYLIFRSDTVNEFSFAMLYFILSCGGVIYFFLNYKKWIKESG
ncbi:MAG: DUF2157 domain-containing protein [Bacteroidota bacterium]